MHKLYGLILALILAIVANSAFAAEPTLSLNGTGSTDTVKTKPIEKVSDTKNLTLEKKQSDWQAQFLAVITNPSVAYILLLLGLFGLFFELMNPGFVLPGVFGTIALLLALYAFQLLPINYVGLSLLLGGIACMVAEAFLMTFGILGVAGVIAFIIGSIMLMDTSVIGYGIPWSIILIMTLVSIAFVVMIALLTVGSLKRPIITGREGLIGTEGEVLEYHADYVVVRVNGEIWNAQTSEPLEIGQRVIVKKISNLILTVEPLSSLKERS